MQKHLLLNNVCKLYISPTFYVYFPHFVSVSISVATNRSLAKPYIQCTVAIFGPSTTYAEVLRTLSSTLTTRDIRFNITDIQTMISRSRHAVHFMSLNHLL